MGSPRQAIIAERLNLSQSSVSRALRNKPGVRPELCAKVLEIAREVGYRIPESITPGAQTTPQGHMVGVLVHSPQRRWRQGPYIAGMSAAAPRLNASLIFHHVETADCHSILDPQHQPPLMRNGMMLSLILVFRWPDDVVRELSKRYACVSLQHDYANVYMDVVRADYGQAMQAMMQHLYDLGHRRIGFIGRCGELSWSRWRFTGYLDSLFQLGLDFGPKQVVEVQAEVLERYLDRDERWNAYVDNVAEQVRRGVRAWMAASDWAGYCLCRGLIDRGFRVPEDVSITGFDATDEAELGCPRLTSMFLPLEDMGAEAVRRAVHRQSHGDEHEPAVYSMFRCTLRPGQSTGPVATA